MYGNPDEFRYLWKKMSGDVSLAADITFPIRLVMTTGRPFFVIRQSLDDDARSRVALHGATDTLAGGRKKTP